MSRYNLLDRVVWPKQTSIIEPDDPEILSKRNVYKEGNGSSGSFLSEKMNRTVEYESHLEWDIYNIIEQSDEVKFYQEQPFEIPYFLKNKEYAYYPDVLIILNDGRGIVVEIKPLSDMVLFINIKKYNSMIKFCTEKGFGYLMTDKKNCYTDIDNFKTDPLFENAILNKVTNKPILWEEYQLLKKKYNAKTEDFVSLILKNGLTWSLPFKISL